MYRFYTEFNDLRGSNWGHSFKTLLWPEHYFSSAIVLSLACVELEQLCDVRSFLSQNFSIRKLKTNFCLYKEIKVVVACRIFGMFLNLNHNIQTQTVERWDGWIVSSTDSTIPLPRKKSEGRLRSVSTQCFLCFKHRNAHAHDYEQSVTPRRIQFRKQFNFP